MESAIAALLRERLTARLLARYAQGECVALHAASGTPAATTVCLDVPSEFASLSDFCSAARTQTQRGGRIIAGLARAEHRWTTDAPTLQAALDEAHLRVVAVIPYGATLYALGHATYLRGSYAWGKSWERVLSWSLQQPAFLAALAYVEEEIVGRLPTNAAGRYMLVAQNEPGPSANAAWRAHDDGFCTSLAGGLCRANIEPFLPGLWEEWQTGLTTHMSDPPSLCALARASQAWLRVHYPVDLESLLASDQYAFCAAIGHRLAIDVAIAELLERFTNDPRISDSLAPRPGMDPAFGLDLVPQLIRVALGIR